MDTSTKVYKGKVKWFNDSKGYGFIEGETKELAEVYAHYRDIEGNSFRTLSDDQLVSFEVLMTSMGPRALKITKLTPNARPTYSNDYEEHA